MAPLVVMAGPTASGKSALALELALRLNAVIINADSQQVYRGLDIGTGKPTPEERARVPHHLYDIADPWEQLDAGRFIAAADRCIGEVRARGRLPLVVGGTGLWLRALIRGLVDAPPRDNVIRERLENEAEELGWPALHERLRSVDPASAENIRPTDPVRITRALEVYELSGERLSDLHARHREQSPRYEAIFLALDRPAAELELRIATRARAMFETGLLEETRNAAADPRAVPRLEMVMGYREALLHLRGALPLEEAIQLTARAQRQYAKRQRTWFRAEPQWRWLNAAQASSPEATATELRELIAARTHDGSALAGTGLP